MEFQMGNITFDQIRKKPFELIPDGKTVVWADLLKAAGEYRSQVEGLAFGAPDSISRRGNNFIARGGKPASTTKFGVTVHAERTVTFTVTSTEKSIDVTNITGVRVKPPVLGEFNLRTVNISMDAKGNFVVKTRVFFVPIVGAFNNKGELAYFRVGS
jgi:hypothetical protein